MAPISGQPPLPPWGNALAGATGALLANAIVYPLDMYTNTLFRGPLKLMIEQRQDPSSSSDKA